MPRLPAVATAIVSAALLAACSGATSSPSAPPSATTRSDPPPATTSPPTTQQSHRMSPRHLRRLDFGGTRILPGHTVVAYYGTAGTSSLGVLGDRPPAAEWNHVLAASRPFANAYRPAVPAYELITDVEQGSPGPHHDYVHSLPAATIADYLKVVHREHGLLMLDIQPGRDDFLPLAKKLRHWLLDPDVDLGLDPEWKLYGHQKPDRQIGHTDAGSINHVSAWLSKLTVGHNLPQKLLIVHQFTAQEIHDYQDVKARPRVATVFNMDGFGSPQVKLASYRIVRRQHRRFPLGFKLFYRQDTHMLSPRRTLSLQPPPRVIEYE